MHERIRKAVSFKQKVIFQYVSFQTKLNKIIIKVLIEVIQKLKSTDFIWSEFQWNKHSEPYITE